MAIKYYSDGTYTKGDGKLYRPGIGVVGSDKSTTVSKAESGSSTSTSSNKSSSSSNKSSGISSMYQNSTSGSTGNSFLDGVKNTMSSNTTSAISNVKNNTSSGSSSSKSSSNSKGSSSTSSPSGSSVSILDKMMENVVNNPISSSGSSSNVNKTDSGWYVPSGSAGKTEPEINPYEEKYNELLEAYKKQEEQMNANNNLYESKYNELQGLLSSNQEKYDELLGSLNSYEQKYNDLLNAPNPYEQKYNDLQKAYEEQEEAIREQNRLAVEQGVNRLNSQKSNINQSAEDNARQAYIMHMQAQKALPQQLASQGVTGGATETANLGLSTTYQNNLNDINRNKINALQDIDNAIVDLQNTGDLSTVEQVLANNQMALDAYMSNLDKQVGYNQWAAQFNANRAESLAEQAYRDKVYADQMAQQQLENNWYEQSYKDKIAQDEMDAYNNAVAEQNKLLANQKEAERDNILKLYSNGQIDRSYAAALLGIPEEYLYDQMGYLTANNQLNLKDKQTGINNTQSLISNRNNSSSGGNNSSKNMQQSLGDKYYNLATQINNQYFGNATGKAAGDSVIIDNGTGGYMINPDISRSSYLDLIVARAFDSDMSDNEVKTFLNNLGISDSDISRVAAYYLK